MNKCYTVEPIPSEWLISTFTAEVVNKAREVGVSKAIVAEPKIPHQKVKLT